jgi:cell fate (sporulation/competence/biofilm development) regulator YmcA (YheA/YmcA/DUF963 family)
MKLPTMIVMVDGKEETREVSHVQINPITRAWEDQPIVKQGEMIHRDVNGVVSIIKGIYS